MSAEDAGRDRVRVDDAALAARLRPTPDRWQRTTLRRAAVLAPIFERAGEDWLVFVVRRKDLRKHPGQIAFPGGVAEDGEDPVACALRETHEEIGVPPAHVTVLGEVATRQSSSSLRVHCLVGRIQDPGEIVPDPGELERVILAPFRQLCVLERWYMHAPPRTPPWPLSPHFELADGELLWGLTGRFAYDLVLQVARKGC